MVVESTFVLGKDESRRLSSEHVSQTMIEPAAPSLGVLFDRVLDAVVVASLKTGRIVLWNPAAEKLFGYTAADAVGESLEILMAAPIADLHRAGLQRYLRTGHGLIIDADGAVEMPSQHKDGTSVRVELSLSELSDAQGERFAVAVMRDAMYRKHLELTNLQLIQERVGRSEAEAEIALRDDLLDAVATTLDAHPRPSELARISSALSDFRQVHGGQVTLQPENGDLVDLLHAAVDSVRRRAMATRIFVHAPPSVPARFDAMRTRQILDQVLDEALQRSAGASAIEVRLEQPTVKTAVLTVRAQGTGVSRKPGVGLHLSRTLMQRQGGTLTTALTSNGGLEVGLTFPGYPRPARARRSRRPAGRQSAG
jgi:PAS domain S-box-containing protein